MFLVHHGDAVGPDVDPRRPLSAPGREAVVRLAAEAAARGARPAVVWHSGKLRARQTAEEFWRACNALAELSAVRDLQPDDQPAWMRDRLRGESRDVMLVGHYPHLPALLQLLTHGSAVASAPFPQHGIVALETRDDGETWKEVWKLPSGTQEGT
ncbi:MAG: phosphohistidine phosphatase SixA [Acidobacteria bacterium]|nr:phosphohistidine phosphatase SixA [Acidobacteriota bacterium]